MRNIILIAPPAAGKGTVAKLLVDKYGYVHISTGDILRDMAKVENEFGKNLASLLQEGKLIPDDIVYEAVEKRLSMPDLSNGYILDGFPRNLEQAIKYDEILKNINRDLGVVIELKTPKEVLEKRITGRYICSDCGATHNTLTGVNTPKVDGVCNECGGKLNQRKDDNYESFQVRYQTYLDKTYPLIDFYQEKGILSSIDSYQPEDTFKEIEAIIND